MLKHEMLLLHEGVKWDKILSNLYNWQAGPVWRTSLMHC